MQVGTPFLMRYLRREDTALKITACREQIMFALNQFQVRLSTFLIIHILRCILDDHSNAHLKCHSQTYQCKIPGIR